MRPYTKNGSIIGQTMSLAPTERYVLGTETSYSTLTYVGGAVVGHLGTTNNRSLSLTALTGGTDSAPQAGDLVIVVLAIGAGSTLSYRISGYTQIGNYFAADTYGTVLQIGYKIMEATPDTSITITGGGGSNANGLSIAAQVWRNFDSSNIFNFAEIPAVVETIANTGIPNPNPITTLLPGSIIIMAAASGHNSGGYGYSTSYLSNLLTTGVSDSYSISLGTGHLLMSSPGSYDGDSWTWNRSDSTSFSNVSVSLVLQPSLTQSTIYGNIKNSGIWDLNSVYDFRASL